MLKRSGMILAALGILISVVAATLLIGDIQEFRDSWHSLEWTYLAWLLPLGVGNHVIRYWRWEILTEYVAKIRLTRLTALLIFSAGSLFIFTPGRVGEVAKSVYARDYFGIPIATSLPVLIAERVSDLIVMALLAAAGLLLLGETPNLLIGSAIGLAVIIVVMFRMSILSGMARLRVPQFLRRLGYDEFLSQANTAQRSLFTHRISTYNFLLGAFAWMVEAAIFFFSLSAVGIEPGFHLFAIAVAVFPLASLAGSFSFLPAGIGVTEGGLVALGILMGNLPEEKVILAALLARAVILGVLIIGFTLGWQNILPWLASGNVDKIAAQCEVACATATIYDYCSKTHELNDGENEYSDTCYNFAYNPDSKTGYADYKIDECAEITCP